MCVLHYSSGPCVLQHFPIQKSGSRLAPNWRSSDHCPRHARMIDAQIFLRDVSHGQVNLLNLTEVLTAAMALVCGSNKMSIGFGIDPY
jgi:hypothetical protein